MTEKLGIVGMIEKINSIKWFDDNVLSTWQDHILGEIYEFKIQGRKCIDA